MIFYLGLLALVGIAALVALIEFVRIKQQTIIAFVHPFDIGGNREETDGILRQVAAFSHLHFPQGEYNAVLEDSDTYREKLSQCIRRFLPFTILLIEERSRMEDTLLELTLYTPMWLRRVVRVLEVESKAGRSTPSRGDWSQLCEGLSRLGVKNVHFVGCFVGLQNGELIPPKYEYYCINEAIVALRASGLFTTVDYLPEYTFVKQVYQTRKNACRLKAPTSRNHGGRARRRK